MEWKTYVVGRADIMLLNMQGKEHMRNFCIFQYGVHFPSLFCMCVMTHGRITEQWRGVQVNKSLINKYKHGYSK